MRMIEAMHCIEYYTVNDPDIARLGKHIPERLCKDSSIQKRLATTAATMSLVRMFCSILGAIPIGSVADRYGRKVVLIMHKLNVVFAIVMQLMICM